MSVLYFSSYNIYRNDMRRSRHYWTPIKLLKLSGTLSYRRTFRYLRRFSTELLDWFLDWQSNIMRTDWNWWISHRLHKIDDLRGDTIEVIKYVWNLQCGLHSGPALPQSCGASYSQTQYELKLAKVIVRDAWGLMYPNTPFSVSQYRIGNLWNSSDNAVDPVQVLLIITCGCIVRVG